MKIEDFTPLFDIKKGGINWIPGYGVRCNNCFTYFRSDDDIPPIYESEHDPNHKGLTCCGCPICMTDEYLMDAPGYEGGIWHGKEYENYLLLLTLYGAYCDYCKNRDTEIETFESFIKDPHDRFIEFIADKYGIEIPEVE